MNASVYNGITISFVHISLGPSPPLSLRTEHHLEHLFALLYFLFLLSPFPRGVTSATRENAISLVDCVRMRCHARPP